ncbi:hypothetical protein E1200_27685 [Actinomadura sp. GC306]|uniref:DUF6461 domain-containing protein n=1 Tax=Actinomadura sp. GC306 TaxID=2530367 RepID=UPI001050094D|nr:DUF6461 domain-containing protein [Actinomadura sp. GC306]TDC61905.1 hypothetical protein E1200_27685 [Actinomadura sp. GC306]
MLNVPHDAVDWVADDERLGEIFCLTFVKGVDETEALVRLGGLPDELRPRTLKEVGETSISYDAGYPEFAFALNLGDWTVLIEPNGFQGGLIEPLTALSRGTEAVSVQRHDYADHGFCYAVDGTLITGFEPTWPSRRWGSDPDRLTGLMRAADLPPDPKPDLDVDVDLDLGLDLDPDLDPDLDTEVESLPRGYVPALLLAGLITGVLPHPDALTGELPSAQIQPWFSAAPPSRTAGPKDPAMVAALEAAPPHLLRAVAAHEAMRLAAVLGLDATPGLAETVAAAERGEPVAVSPGSELGAHVRSWLVRSRQASYSLNDGAYSRMSDDERTAAFMLGWFASALRAALWPEPHAAARAALHPLTEGPTQLRDSAQEAAVLRILRGDQAAI